jgi:hypothetical protein
MRSILLLICIFSVTLTAEAQIFKTYNTGYYYSASGQKVTGLISFVPYHDKIFFKPDKESKSQKINIEEIQSVVTSQEDTQFDSLSVKTENGKPDKKYLAKLILQSPSGKLYYRYKAMGGAGMPSMGYQTVMNPSARGSQPNFTTNMVLKTSGTYYGGSYTILMYEENGTTYELKKSNYKQVLATIMADNTGVVNQINNNVWKFKDTYLIITEYNSNNAINKPAK